MSTKVSEKNAIKAWQNFHESKSREEQASIRRALKAARDDGRSWGSMEPIRIAAMKYVAIMGAPTVLYCMTHRKVVELNDPVAPCLRCQLYPKKLFDADDNL